MTGECVVSGMSGDNRKLQLLRQHVSSVSRAAWPASIQHCVATSRAAQRRRSLMIKKSNSKKYFRFLHFASFYMQYKPILLKLYSHLLVALLTGSLVLGAYILYQWSTLLILFALCIVTFLVTIQLLVEDRPSKESTANASQPPRTELPQQPPMALDFPETPMPATPLIRVLETIDLSTSNVEHFITPPPSTQLPAELQREETLSSREQES